MAGNSLKKNAEKAGAGAIVTAVATSLVATAVALAKARGIEIDGLVQGAAVAAVSGVILGALNWFKHRKKG